MRNLPLVAHHFRVNQCAVQWRWMKGGGEWGEVGAAGLHWAVCRSQLPGLSRQGIRWMLRPNALPASVAAALSPAVLRMDGAICDEHGGVCVGGGGTGGRVDRKMTGGGSGVRQSASRRSTIESHRRTTRPARLHDRSGTVNIAVKTAWGMHCSGVQRDSLGILCSRREGSGVAVQATAMRRHL